MRRSHRHSWSINGRYGGPRNLVILGEFTDFQSSSAACCTLQQVPAQTEPHCRQGVPRSAHVGKWGIPRLEQLLVVGDVVGKIDNAGMFVAAYMHNIGSPSDFGAGCFYRPMILIIMWGFLSLAVFSPRIHLCIKIPIIRLHR